MCEGTEVSHRDIRDKQETKVVVLKPPTLQHKPRLKTRKESKNQKMFLKTS